MAEDPDVLIARVQDQVAAAQERAQVGAVRGTAFSPRRELSVTADDFAKEAFAKGEVPGIITVDGLNGSDVTALSRYQNEGEVLYQRGTEFEVVSKVQDAQGTWRIHLREVR